MSSILSRLKLRRTGDAQATAEAAAATRAPRTRFGAWLGRPMTSFHLIIAVAALLVSLGLIMVLSASGVHSYDEDGSPWVIFGKQLIWTLVGLFAFYAAMRMRGADHAQPRVHRLRVQHRAARSGADPRNRQGGQRFPWLVRRRRAVDAAVGAGEDRVRDLGCAPARGPPHGARLAAGDAHPAGARRRDRARAHRRRSPTSGRRCRSASSCWPCSGTRACRCGCSCQLAVRRRRLGRCARHVRGLPVRPGACPG